MVKQTWIYGFLGGLVPVFIFLLVSLAVGLLEPGGKPAQASGTSTDYKALDFMERQVRAMEKIAEKLDRCLERR